MSRYLFHTANAAKPGGGESLAPGDISGLRAHWDAALGVSVDGSDQVTSWTDQSGNGYTLTSVAGNEPLYDDANDRIHFRGDTRVEYLENQSWNFDITTNTVVFVWEPVTLTSNNGVFGQVGGAALYQRSYLDTIDNMRFQPRNSATNVTHVASMTDNTIKFIGAYRFDEASNQKVTTDQSSEVSYTHDFSTASNNMTEIYFGVLPQGTNRNFFSAYEAEAYFYECAIYDTFISDSDLTSLLNHFKTKYSIT